MPQVRISEDGKAFLDSHRIDMCHRSDYRGQVFNYAEVFDDLVKILKALKTAEKVKSL